MKKIIQTKLAPTPVGPYSQAVEVDGWIFCSGQISLDPKSNELNLGDVQSQTRQVINNIEGVLGSVDLSLNDVVKTTIFITNMGDFSQINEVYAEFFSQNPPARSCVEVSGLPKGVSVEIEVVAKR